MPSKTDTGMLVPIREAAQIAGVSMMTLRRMNAAGLLDAVRNVPRGKRFFFKSDLLALRYDAYARVRAWIRPGTVPSPRTSEGFYYADEGTVNGLVTIGIRERLNGLAADDYISIIVSAAMELLNNAFYHNQGQWPDVEGVFYHFDRVERKLIVADRGVGLLENLRRVRGDLRTHADVLRVAFTEQISSRPVEGHRGYGLKHARLCVVRELKRLVYQTGDARLEIRAKDEELHITEGTNPVQGCLAILEF